MDNGNYYFVFELLAYLNTVLLLIYSVASVFYFKKLKSKILKNVAFYLIFCCVFDLSYRVTNYLINDREFLTSVSIGFRLLFRLGELWIVGYLLNYYLVKSKLVWLLMVFCSIYLCYDYYVFQSVGIERYAAFAQITTNILLILLVVYNLLKQLKHDIPFSMSNQMLSLVFLTYFSIHLVFAVFQNFTNNQSFIKMSFTLFYSIYAVLHLIYYFSLALILYKSYKNVNFINTN